MLNLYKLRKIEFPKDFIWGSATAGHQIEGGNVNSNQWHAELTDTVTYLEPSGMACNSYALYKEDIELLKQLGHQAYRFSIEWSRIQPREDIIDDAALAHYQDMLDRLKAAGIKTSVTLHHYTHPQWFEEKGGWKKRENLKFFLQYLEFLVPKIADRVDSWCVLNEFNMRDIKNPDHKLNMLKAHGFGYRIIKQYSNAPVSSAHAFLHEAPKRPRDFMDNAMADFLDWSNNEFFFHAVRTGEIVFPFRDMEYVPELKDSCDFWAVNFYNRHVIDARSAGGKARPFDFNRYRTVDADFYNCEFTPESFMVNLSRLNDKPIHITENGFCAEDDRFRIISLALNLSALHEAIKLYHLDVREYYYWSLMDNYEWQTFTPRFGLVHVDFKTFERVPKPSAGCYREIIANNGFDGSMIEKYVPELPKFTLYDNPDIHK